MLRRPVMGFGSGALALALAFGAAPAFAVSTPTSVTLSWTAPGDDADTGTAALYDVRYSSAPIDAANFAQAFAATGVPAPQVAGSSETMLVTGLSPSTAYWFALRTRDESGNWSGVSNIVQWSTPASSDSVRPAPLAISLTGTTASSVSLGWTAVGDDSLTGAADHYEVRWFTAPITGSNWASATRVTNGVPVPGSPGAAQSCTVTGLDRSADLWFAVRVADEVNNWSVLSNVVAVPAQLDAAPPATPSGLVALAVTGGQHLHWNANTEPDLAGYHVYRAVAAGGPFARIDGSTVATNDYVDTAVPDSAAVWYAVSAVDGTGNESAHAAAVQVWLRAAGINAVHVQPVYPNPSGLTDPVTVPIDVPATGPVDARLDIVNAAGERVRTIELPGLVPGTHMVVWDGRNEAGRLTAPGVYRALLHVGGNDQAVRLVRRP